MSIELPKFGLIYQELGNTASTFAVLVLLDECCIYAAKYGHQIVFTLLTG